MLNIVLPMAGRGQRFTDAGYTQPKPLISIHGRPMIELVIGNLRPKIRHRFIFLILREHAVQFGLDRRLQEWAPDCQIRYVDRVTEGAACTVLLARDLIESYDPLMIANCDQWVDIDINDYLHMLESTAADGLIMTMWADHPKWSYIRFGEKRQVVEIVEKQVVSHEATVGVYNYRRGADFIRGADRMIAKNIRVNGEFYVAPVYNELLAEGATLALVNVGKEYAGMYGLGTPLDLDFFMRHAICRKACSNLRQQVS